MVSRISLYVVAKILIISKISVGMDHFTHELHLYSITSNVDISSCIIRNAF